MASPDLLPGDGDGSAPEGLPEPPPPEGPGLFGDPAPPPPAAAAKPAPAAPPPAPDAPATPYRVLARKYRPTTFAELVGQDALVRTLRNAFARGRVPHALLLAGVRGVGKTTTARIVARALNCVGPDGTGGPTVDPCGACPQCRAILADNHPDVLELDAASNRGIDDVRELRELVRYRPAMGRKKVIILDEVHMLTQQAFNALLKTLEEPPGDVTFMLATTQPRDVPATIRSRCQTHALRRVPQPALRGHFARVAAREGAEVEPEALAMIARAADGSVRDGLSLLDQAIVLAGVEGGAVTAAAVADMIGLADRGLVMDVMEAAVAGDVAACLRLMDRAHERGAEPGVLLADLLELTHTLTRLATVPGLRDDPSLAEEERTRGAALAARLSVPVLGRAWQMLLKGLGEVREAPDPRAAAEMVLIRLAHVAELPTPGDLIKRLTDGGGAVAAPNGAGAPPPPRAPNGGGGAPLRAVAGGGGAVAQPVPAEAPAPAAAAPPQPQTWREVVALASGRRPMLHAQLRHSVHPVRVAPGRVEIRVRPEAPRDLAAQLGALLEEATGARWAVALSNAEGEPTLADQGRAAEADRRGAAEAHPLVQAILAAFPGAAIEAVRDAAADAYGLAAAPAAAPAPPADADGPGDADGAAPADEPPDFEMFPPEDA